MAEAREPARFGPREVVWTDKTGKPIVWADKHDKPMTWATLEGRAAKRAARQMTAKAKTTKPFLD